MFLSKNKKNNVYPCEPQFYYIKVGFKGVIKACFRDVFILMLSLILVIYNVSAGIDHGRLGCSVNQLWH